MSLNNLYDPDTDEDYNEDDANPFAYIEEDEADDQRADRMP